MNKKQFLTTLESSLKKLPIDERQDIIDYYEEHFAIGLEEGKTEEQISSSLGSPRQIAKDMNVNSDNGRLEISNIEGNTVTTKTSNDSTSLQSVKAITVSVKSDNGRIELNDIEGELIGKTSNGSPSLVTSHLDRPIQFKNR